VVALGAPGCNSSPGPSDRNDVAPLPVDDAALLHLHPFLAVVDDPPVLWHVVDGWEDPVPTPQLAAVLRRLTAPTTVGRAIVDAGVTATADAHQIRAQLSDLHDQQLVLDGPAPRPGGGLFSVPATTVGAALAQPGVDGVVIGMPYDVATSIRAGARHAPAELRACGGAAMVLAGDRGVWDPVQERTVLGGRRIVDVGDVDATVHTRNGPTIDRLRSLVRWTAASGALPVVLGGDHSIAHAVTAGVSSSVGEHAVLQLDAHTDRGGAPDDWRAHLHHGNVGDHLAAEAGVGRLVQAGVRQRRPEPPPTHPDIVEIPVHRTQPDAVVDALPPSLPVHLSIDVDVLDPTVVAGTGAPVPGGLDLAAVVAIVEAVARNRRIVAVDCCELIPEHDLAGTLAVAELLARTLIAVLDPIPA